MLEIGKIHDGEKLRKVALLLDREVDRLQLQVRDLIFEIARLKGSTLTQVDFGLPASTLRKILEETAEEPAAPPPPRPPQPGHGPRAQAELPTLTQRHELAPEQRRCAVCGGELQEMSGVCEVSDEITLTERSYTLVLHERQKYRCACNANVVTAPGPVKLIPGGRYSGEFAVHVAVAKYADHLPLERQVALMRRHGLEVTSQTLWDQLEAAAGVLKPTYEALGRWLLDQPLLHVDETGWPVHAKGQDKPRWTAWCLCNEKVQWFAFATSKSAAAGRKLLGEYRGFVVADGYRVYKILAQGRAGPGYQLAHCWAHVLRKFRATAENDERSLWALEKIGQLYKVEREIRLAAAGDPAEHHAQRQKHSKPLVDALHEWALAQGGLRRSDFGRALAYLLSHWQGLTLFLEHARVPLDNNPAERALRGLVIGRKNHYGSRSQQGAAVSALFYSLIGSAKLCHLPPELYLRQALDNALRQPGAVTLPFSPE